MVKNENEVLQDCKNDWGDFVDAVVFYHGNGCVFFLCAFEEEVVNMYLYFLIK